MIFCQGSGKCCWRIMLRTSNSIRMFQLGKKTEYFQLPKWLATCFVINVYHVFGWWCSVRSIATSFHCLRAGLDQACQKWYGPLPRGARGLQKQEMGDINPIYTNMIQYDLHSTSIMIHLWHLKILTWWYLVAPQARLISWLWFHPSRFFHPNSCGFCSWHSHPGPNTPWHREGKKMDVSVL